jgi:phage terminase small subunit
MLRFQQMDRQVLTPLQQGFVTAYLENRGNATQAAITAGCKPASAHVTASRWLKLAKIQAAIQGITDKAAERAEITQSEILGRLRELAMLEPRDKRHDNRTGGNG